MYHHHHHHHSIIRALVRLAPCWEEIIPRFEFMLKWKGIITLYYIYTSTGWGLSLCLWPHLYLFYSSPWYYFVTMPAHIIPLLLRLGPRFLLSVYLQNAGQQPVLGVSQEPPPFLALCSLSFFSCFTNWISISLCLYFSFCVSLSLPFPTSLQSILLFSFDAQLYRFGYGDNVVEAEENDHSGSAQSGGTSRSKQCIAVPILLPVSTVRVAIN